MPLINRPIASTSQSSTPSSASSSSSWRNWDQSRSKTNDTAGPHPRPLNGNAGNSIVARNTGNASGMNSTHAGSKRNASGPLAASWSRLKPVQQDELAAYGLPSKGETRLNNTKAQEAYFQVIFQRYMRFCNTSRDTLAEEFAKLCVVDENAPSKISSSSPPTTQLPSQSLSSSKWASPRTPTPQSTSTSSSPQPPSSSTTSTSSSSPIVSKSPIPKTTPSSSNEEPSPELSLIHMSMRKLRESIHATRRTDDFARDAYLFIARAAILTKSWQSYVPAVAHLTNFIRRSGSASGPAGETLSGAKSTAILTDSDARAVATWMMLDYACRLGDLDSAFQIAYSSKPSSTSSPSYTTSRVNYLAKPDLLAIKLLLSILHSDFISFFKLLNKVDGYCASIASFAIPKMRRHALKCLAVSYLEVEKTWVEKCVGGMEWTELVKNEGVGWELMEKDVKGEKTEIVVIRRVKPKGVADDGQIN